VTQRAGSATVILAVLGHADHGGDLVEPGSLLSDFAVVSRHNHSTILLGEAPVGTARLYEADGRLMAEIVYFEDPDDG
jgi:hypothetical protein